MFRYHSRLTKLSDGTLVAYFRGRKLHGRKVTIPDKYIGVLLSSTELKLPKEAHPSQESEAEGDEQPNETGVLLEHAQFDEFTVWGHEALPDDKQDPYVRAVR